MIISIIQSESYTFTAPEEKNVTFGSIFLIQKYKVGSKKLKYLFMFLFNGSIENRRYDTEYASEYSAVFDIRNATEKISIAIIIFLLTEFFSQKLFIETLSFLILVSIFFLFIVISIFYNPSPSSKYSTFSSFPPSIPPRSPYIPPVFLITCSRSCSRFFHRDSNARRSSATWSCIWRNASMMFSTLSLNRALVR